MRHAALARYFIVAALLAFSGCSGSSTPETAAPEQTTGTAPVAPGSNTSTGTVGGGQSAAPRAQRQAPAPAPAPRAVRTVVVVPAGTIIPVTLDQAISTETNAVGDQFEASVAAPVMVDGKVAIPKGAIANGHVTASEDAGRVQGSARLSIDLDSVTFNGQTVPVQVGSYVRTTGGRGKRTAVGAGAGAAAGAIIGAIAGGGKGAAIGAGTGAGAGTAGAVLTGERNIRLPAETRIEFKLTDDVEVSQRDS